MVSDPVRRASRRERVRTEVRAGALSALGGPLIAGGIALAWTRRAFGPRPAAGDDVLAHVIRAQWAIDHLWLHGHLDGLLPSFAGGYQEFLFFGQGFTALVLAVRILTFGALSTPGAVKVVTMASLACFPLAVSFLARSMGLSARASGVAALLSLLVNSPFGVGPSAVFGPALIPQQVGAILACLCVGGVLRTLTDGRARWMALTALSGALLLSTHVITAFIVLVLLVTILPTLLLTDRPGRAAAGRVALAGLAAFGLAGAWVVPFLAHIGTHGPVTTWSTPRLGRRVADIFSGRFVLRPRVAVVLAAGTAASLGRVVRRRRWALAVLSAPVGFVAASRGLHALSPHNPIAIQLENRGIGLAAVIATFGLAATIAWVTRRARFVGDVLAVGVAIALVAVTSAAWDRVAAQQPVPSAGLAGAARVLGQMLPEGARFVEVRQYPQDVVASGGVQHPDFFLVFVSGHPALNEFNVESTSATSMAFAPEQLLGDSPDYAAEQLRRFGVEAVVASNPATTAQLTLSSGFRPVWSADGWAVLRVLPVAGHPDPATLLATDGPASAQLVGHDPAHLRIRAVAPAATEATIAVAWSPRWALRVDGRRVAIVRSTDGLVEVHLPAGASTVTLDWTGDPWAAVGLMLSLVTLVAGSLAILRRTHVARV